MSLETQVDKMQHDMSAQHGIEIDWETLIDTLIELIDGCFDNERDFIEAAKNPTRLQQAVTRIRGRRNGMSRRQAKAFAECCEHCANDCTDDELAGCYAEVAQLMNGTGAGYGDVE